MFEIGLILYKLDDRHYKSWLDLRTLFFFTVRKSSDISVHLDILMNIFAMIKAWTVLARAVFIALCLNDSQFVSQITPGVVQLF